jgi:hypothetical protein
MTLIKIVVKLGKNYCLYGCFGNNCKGKEYTGMQDSFQIIDKKKHIILAC